MILATAALISSAAWAQTATVEFAPEQRTKIKQVHDDAEGCASDREG